jgi:hypothetical protein
MLMTCVIMPGVVVITVVMVMVGMVCRLCIRWHPSGHLRDGIAKAHHLLFDGDKIAAAVVTYSHRPRGHGDRNVFDTWDASDGAVNLGCAAGAIHAANPVTFLDRFTHDPLPCQTEASSLHPLATRGARGKS